MSRWILVGGPGHHRVQLLWTPVENEVTMLWEHDCPPGYVRRWHRVSSDVGQVWHVDSMRPLTLRPSLHCTPANGGCGVHGFVRAGLWVPA